jgi:cell division protein ZapA
MDGRPVQLRIAGQSYRVVSSASEEELERLANTVSAKVEELTPSGRIANPQAVLLAAMALAHELEEERARRVALERRTRDLLRRILVRLDDAIDCAPEQ